MYDPTYELIKAHQADLRREATQDHLARQVRAPWLAALSQRLGSGRNRQAQQTLPAGVALHNAPQS